ncbi:HD domain-containing protein [Hymenobacter sp. BT186]|uniref:HD domain-containing protein n=1 Tax=Hymenobacter telluris TaxID=2816474 RepID=A0A939JC79_9BACT|nr:HD domain-containing protein [Hymenobacter telluris]MBO0357538.1 HD domain-containing protein [Hymenobacter telluris]MBW3373564.1 HD domain-containing protein [Hymenobacter norwichensis]
MNQELAEKYILHALETQLPATLYYHSVHHTLDVTQAAMQLATAEGITEEEPRKLLRTAALFHDAGFLRTFDEHEAAGCELVHDVLPGFEYSPAQIETICAMITATKLPQAPHSHLAEILCDADLDYLGRPDFEPIANTLFLEFQARQIVAADENAWNRLQEQFLVAHHYWTTTAITNREASKQARLAAIRAKLAS